MFVYFFVIFVLYFLFFMEIMGYNEKKSRMLFYIGAILVTFILAFRGDNVGGDTMEYCDYFEGKWGPYGTVDDPNPEFGVGFVFFSQLLSFLFGPSRFVFIFITSILTIVPFLYIVWRDSKYKLMPLCLYMTCFFLLSLSQTCIRQNVSLFFLFMLYILLTGKYGSSKWMYLGTPIMLVCSVLCHTTSVLTILLALFVFLVPLNRLTSGLLVVISAVFMLTMPNFTNVLLDRFFFYFSIFEDVQHFTDYAFVSGMERKSGFVSIFTMTIFICVYLRICSVKQLCNESLRSFPLKCLVWGVVFTFLLSGFQLGVRIVLFLTFMGITASPWELTKINKIIFTVSTITIMFFFAYNQIKYLAFSKSAITYDQLVPYNFIFE